MGERKVLNKYIPADFDPSLVPKGKKLSAKDGTVDVRMMLPFSVQCSTCHTFLYRGRKFNSKKEPMGGPNGRYLGITRWRFYIKCTHCSRPLTFLTDPQNADYEMQKDKAATEEDAEATKEEEEKLDPMKALENRVLESQQELADLDNLEEIKAMNARHVKLLAGKSKGKIVRDADDEHDDDAKMELTAEDEALVQSIQFGKKPAAPSSEIKRLDEDDERRLEEERQREAAKVAERLATAAAASQTLAASKPAALPILVKKKRKRIEDSNNGDSADQKPAAKNTAPAAAAGLAGLLGGYGSDSSDE